MRPGEAPEPIGPVTRRVRAAGGRDYVTPEDVAAAVEEDGASAAEVQLEVLRILGRTTGWGAEDAGLCAFVAADLENRAERAKGGDGG